MRKRIEEKMHLEDFKLIIGKNDRGERCTTFLAPIKTY